MRFAPSLAAAAAAVLAPIAAMANGDTASVTFAKDVAPILYENCVACHRAGDIAPMSLLTFDEVRPWAKAIQREVVQERQMPPWHSVDPHGTFKNERGLTDEQIATIDTWIKQGTKPGDLSEMPPAPEFPNEWRLGEPDMVLTFDPIEVPAEGDDVFHDLMVTPQLDEDKWVTAIEIRPSDRRVVHHVIIISLDNLKANEGSAGVNGWLGGWAAGAPPIAFPEGYGRVVKAGVPIVANMHYHPYGEATTEQTTVGLHFADNGAGLSEIRNQWVLNSTFEIPPGAASHEVRASYIVPEDSRLMNILPHMHFRGKDMIITATLPDGSKKTLVEVPRYDFNWQTIYEYNEPVDLPQGTVVDVIGHFNNSPENPANPDATKAITWGPQSTDEMLIGMLDLVKADSGDASGD